MPVIQIDLLKGKSVEQKRALVEKITTACVDALQCPQDAVTIVLRDMEPTDYSVGGTLFADNV